MGDKDPRPILVTGAHRSGTTWVGKMLAADPNVAYISEPLNIWHRPGVMRVPTRYWYTYICEENQSEFQVAFQEMLRFEYHSWREVKSLHSVRDIFRMGRDWGTFSQTGFWLPVCIAKVVVILTTGSPLCRGWPLKGLSHMTATCNVLFLAAWGQQ